MLTEELEFRLSQYLDGTLSVDEAAVFFEELSQNPAALAALDEYRRLDLILKSPSEPNVNWAELAEHISGQLEESSRWQIGRFVSPLRWALAASIVLAVGAATWLGLRSMNGSGVNGPAGPIAVAQIVGPIAEPAAGAAVMQIDIGPSPAVAHLAVADRYADLIQRPTQVAIASGVIGHSDERMFPF